MGLTKKINQIATSKNLTLTRKEKRAIKLQYVAQVASLAESIELDQIIDAFLLAKKP